VWAEVYRGETKMKKKIFVIIALLYGLALILFHVVDIPNNLVGRLGINTPGFDMSSTSIAGVFRRDYYFELPHMASNVRYYFHADNTVERWHFGNRILNGTYSISDGTITLFRGDGTIEGRLTISPDGQTLWGMFTTYSRVLGY